MHHIFLIIPRQTYHHYCKLIRVSHQMRKLQVSKHFGAVYGTSASHGNLAIFSPSCPQPGINLPPDRKDLLNWMTHHTITMDGNFHADHIKMCRPDMDVMLTNGQEYMVEAIGYQEYISAAKEPCAVGLNIFLFEFIFTCLTRGQHARITELSMAPTLTIGTS